MFKATQILKKKMVIFKKIINIYVVLYSRNKTALIEPNGIIWNPLCATSWALSSRRSGCLRTQWFKFWLTFFYAGVDFLIHLFKNKSQYLSINKLKNPVDPKNMLKEKQFGSLTLNLTFSICFCFYSGNSNTSSVKMSTV